MSALGALREQWSARAPREKSALAAAAAIALLAIVYLTLVEPAVQGVARLQHSLPQTRAQAARLDSLLAEARTLKTRAPVANVPPQQARTTIDASLTSAGLKATRIVPLPNGDLQLVFTGVPYARWTVWLAGAERELGAHAVSVSANATATPGSVDAELVLRLERG